MGLPGRPRSGDPGGNRRGGADPAAKAKADKLHASGMPFQMAIAVAQGRLALNDALERMARKDKVVRLMERHNLSRALATQVAIGHADLDHVLARQRLDQHREQHRDRSFLVPGEQPVALACHGGRIVEGRILAVEPYMVLLQPKTGTEPEAIHKLQIKYAYPAADWKRVKKGVRIDKKGAEAKEPVIRPQDRYTCSDRRLFGYMDRKVEVSVTLLEGDQLRGTVTWFSRYEFGLQLKSDGEVVVFRHALQHIGTA
jgi:sRNA-binding regulator protein Hfq